MQKTKTWCWLEHIGVPKNLAFVTRISRWSKIRVECRLGGPQWRCHSCGCHWLRLLQSESSCHCHLGVEGDGTCSFSVERSNESTGTGSWTKVWGIIQAVCIANAFLLNKWVICWVLPLPSNSHHQDKLVLTQVIYIQFAITPICKLVHSYSGASKHRAIFVLFQWTSKHLDLLHCWCFFYGLYHGIHHH